MPALLLIPGLLNTGRVFHHQLEALSGRVDAHVAEPWHHDSVAAMAEAALALAPPRFALAGFSMGGYVAFEILRRAPQRVERLVLVDAGGYAFTSRSVPLGFRLARLPVARDLAGSLLPRSLVERSVREVYGDPSRVDAALVDRYYELALRKGNRRALVQRFEQVHPGAEAASITRLRVPTLVLWGGRDHLIPPEHAAAFGRDIAGSRVVVFDELGHVPHEEDSARTVAEVRRFLGLAPVLP